MKDTLNLRLRLGGNLVEVREVQGRLVSVSIVGVVQITIIKAAWSVVRSQHGATQRS